MKYSVITVLFLLVISACTENASTVKAKEVPARVYEGNLFLPIYLGNLFESPNAFGTVFDLDFCEAYQFKKISLYVKGGYLPNKMSEKHTYTFHADGDPKDYAHYIYNVSRSPFSSSSFQYGSTGKLSKIDISKFLDFSNLPPVLVESDSVKTWIVTSKGDGKNDSLLFFPSIKNPEVILQVVNNFVNNLEIFVPKGTASGELKELISRIDTNLVRFELTEKTVTYLSDGIPTESYQLDKSWNRKVMTKSWKYNANKQPVQYQEWLHGTLIKDIEISYQSNNLPSEIIVDRKKFIFYSEN